MRNTGSEGINILLAKLKKGLSNRSGSMLIIATGALFCLSILASVMMEYRQAYIIASGTEEMVRKATVTMAVNNSYGAYTGVRDARSNAYGALGDGGWDDIANTADLKRQLRKLFDFKTSGSKLTNTNSRGTEFVLDIKSIRYNNELSDADTLLFDVEYELEIPMRFMGEIATTAEITHATQVEYNPKY